MTDTELRYAAMQVLKENDTGNFIKPAYRQYPHQWNWDAALIAIGLRTYDVPRARKEILSLLSGQWSDGMIPHILYPTGASDYFPIPDFWRTEGLPHGPAYPTSGLTQPPVLATAVRLIHKDATDKDASLAFVKEVYPKVLAWHRWFYAARDPEGTGLVAIIHPWESGMDNSTRWSEALSRIKLENVPSYQRKDFQHVREEERPSAQDYEYFMYLIGRYRDLQWEPEALYSKAPFLIQDVLLNAILARANTDLLMLGTEIGEPTTEIEGWLDKAREAFNERLWNHEEGLYFDYDLRAARPVQQNTCAALSPLYSGLPSSSQAQRLVDEHLSNPDEYAPGPNGQYYIPSTSKNSPLFEARRYWRGPVWININWFIIQGLRTYGYHDLADVITKQSLELVSKSGFVEYFDTRDGAPLGAEGFSWSAALTLDLLSELT